MAALSWEGWRRIPNPGARVECPHGEAHTHRRSGDERYWEDLRFQIEARPWGSRPWSCIEGDAGRLEGWLPQPERMKSDLTLSDGRLSMPTLKMDAIHCHRLGLISPFAWSTTHCQPAIQHDTPQHGKGLLSPGRQHRESEPLGRWEMARFKTIPKGESSRSCSLAPVKSSWLPTQRTAVLCSIPSHPACAEKQECWATLNSNTCNTPPKDLLRKNGDPDPETMGKCVRWRGPTGSPTWCFSGPSPVRVDQVAAENVASTDCHFLIGQEDQLKKQERVQEDCSQREVCAAPSGGYPLNTTESASAHSSITAPPAVCSTNLVKSRSGFSSITITSRKVRPPSTCDLGIGLPSRPIMSRSTTPSTPPASTPTDLCRQPVIRQRKVTVIKVTDPRQSCMVGQPLKAFRDSFAMVESGQNNNRPIFNLSHFDSPPSDGVRSDDHTDTLADPSRSVLLQRNTDIPEGDRPKVHRSTLTLYLNSPIPRGAALDRKEGKEGLVRPSRPLSFVEGLGLSGGSLCEVKVLHPRRASLQLPGESCADGAVRGACSFNTHTCAAGLSRRDTDHAPKQPCNAVGKVFAKAQDRGTSQNSDITLNAASVIANIKRQSQLRKMTLGPRAEGFETPHSSACALGNTPHHSQK